MNEIAYSRTNKLVFLLIKNGEDAELDSILAKCLSPVTRLLHPVISVPFTSSLLTNHLSEKAKEKEYLSLFGDFVLKKYGRLDKKGFCSIAENAAFLARNKNWKFVSFGNNTLENNLEDCIYVSELSLLKRFFDDNIKELFKELARSYSIGNSICK